MEIILDEIEARVLGALIEKEMSTPEYYPQSLNALTNACNQKSNRDPVVAYDEAAVEQALGRLAAKNLVWQNTAGRGVMKYGESLVKTLNLIPKEAALICELLLRGPQTPGELKNRAPRLAAFEGWPELNQSLQDLERIPLVAKLPRSPGQKEARFTHLFFGAVSAPETSAPAPSAAPDRRSSLEQEVQALRRELQELKDQFQEFKKQFE